MNIVPFKAAHLELLDPRPGPAMLALARYHEEAGPAWSGFQGERLMGCMGGTIEGDEMTCWAALSVGWQRRCLETTRLARRFLKDVRERYGVQRVSACVQDGVPGADGWLRIMGFRYERDVSGWLGTPLLFRKYAL